MTINEFFEKLGSRSINQDILSKIQEVYGNDSTKDIKEILSFSLEGEFFDSDDMIRLLSTGEIINAEEELHVNFVNKNIIPVFDTGENNFIVFNYDSKTWLKFNIIDEVFYKEDNTLKGVIVG